MEKTKCVTNKQEEDKKMLVEKNSRKTEKNQANLKTTKTILIHAKHSNFVIQKDTENSLKKSFINFMHHHSKN